MSTLIQSLSLVTFAEIGDKTQILSILLSTQFKRFWPICLGILVATLANHALAALAGNLLTGFADTFWLEIITASAFAAIGLWILLPDNAPLVHKEPKYGAFLTSTIVFFIAEMGDKTQFATITLGAHYSPLWQVVVGTTVGMLVANVPAILVGEHILKVIPLKAVRIITCLIFISFSATILWKIFH